MIAAILVAHLVGDYLLQSHWMAVEKVNKWLPAIAHGVTYTLPFLFITQSVPALLVICITHIIIDHYRLAKHFSWFKNQFGPKGYRVKDLANNGYGEGVPAWLSTFLMIVTDNTLHILINILAVMYL